ncbi:MAG: hypothetical protein J0I44_00845, partial [Microbacterium sp.]|nr:hypothetical protein [Microbacterium sp.]
MNTPDDDVLNRVSSGSYHAPHDILGLHPDGAGGWTVRARRPLAQTVTAVFADGDRVDLDHVVLRSPLELDELQLVGLVGQLRRRPHPPRPGRRGPAPR